ncbi:MAG: hypothetical protein M0R28_20145 [Pigmentiphaga sp.]|nr:hypothetical protein [Pigmentiphaga sp.]
MALVFPLALEDFFDTLPIQAVELYLSPSSVVTGRTRGGDVLTADIGERSWGGSCSLGFQNHVDAAAVRSRLSILLDGGRSFLAPAMPNSYPRKDRDGSILGAATPSIHTVAANNREVRIQGLPVAYVISPGDYLSATYGSNPTRYGFLQAVTGAEADGSGLTPLFEVTPFVPSGLAATAPVTLVRPIFKAVIAPGSVNWGSSSDLLTRGMSFSFIQTLR